MDLDPDFGSTDPINHDKRLMLTFGSEIQLYFELIGHRSCWFLRALWSASRDLLRTEFDGLLTQIFHGGSNSDSLASFAQLIYTQTLGEKADRNPTFLSQSYTTHISCDQKWFVISVAYMNNEFYRYIIYLTLHYWQWWRRLIIFVL